MQIFFDTLSLSINMKFYSLFIKFIKVLFLWFCNKTVRTWATGFVSLYQLTSIIMRAKFFFFADHFIVIFIHILMFTSISFYFEFFYDIVKICVNSNNSENDRVPIDKKKYYNKMHSSHIFAHDAHTFYIRLWNNKLQL